MSINGEYCQDFPQLVYYCTRHIRNRDVYESVFLAAFYGVMSNWLRAIDKYELANEIDLIDKQLSESEYMEQVVLLVTGDQIALEKPPYDQCFEITKFVYDRLKENVVIRLDIKIIEHINENYKLTIASNCGEETFDINTFEYDNKTIISKEFKYAIPHATFKASLMIDGHCIRQIKKDIPEIFVDGHSLTAVDLGLSVFWADRNIGASSPHDMGKHFTYNEIPSSFEGPWRLPTKEECEELQTLLRQTGNYISDGHRTIPVPEKTITGRTGRTMTIPRSGYYVNPERKIINDENFGYFWSCTSEVKGTRYCLRSDGTLFKQYDEKYLLPVRLVCTKVHENLPKNDCIKEDRAPIVDTKNSVSTVVSGVHKHTVDILRQAMENAIKVLNETKKD